jgi:ABC-type transporter Mla subunit MlaD
MSSARGAFLRVGLLVAVGLAAAVGLVLFLSGERIRAGHMFESYFQESVQGLELGAPVKFRGVSLGEVSEIGLVSAAYAPPNLQGSTYRLVYVRYIIDLARTGRLAGLEPAVSSGLRARLASQGITGLSYIELDFVDPAQFPMAPVPWKPAYDVIPSVPSTLAQVQDAAQALLARLNAVDIVALGHSAQRLLDDLHGQLAAGGDAQQALAGAAALTVTAREAVQSADIPGLAAELRGAIAGVRALATGPQTREMLAATARATERLSDMAARLPALVTALEATVRRTSGGVSDLQSDLVPLLRDARAAAANLRETTEALRRYPAGVLLGGPPPHAEDTGR